ncbi:MAG: exodeoxyribonuclease III [Oscillospiraceae bacterium]|jgi:exodeoxyribonuclease-3|nr:exodeoxyribonuclease III [Oscillospiraceae bacterium]
MKLISWNVNGLRACLKKGFLEVFHELDADIFCLQETKMIQGQADIDLNGQFVANTELALELQNATLGENIDDLSSGHYVHLKENSEINVSSCQNGNLKYSEYWNSAEKKGYSGTAIFTRIPPLAVFNGMDIAEHDSEGRMITLEFENFYLVNVYTPNSQEELRRLEYRMKWEDTFREYVTSLDKSKPVIICGDLNVAHTEIDLKNPKTNTKSAGFSIEERNKFTELLNAGFTDYFRHLYPDKTDAYTWWSYMFKARERNTGWRIDYFIGSNRLTDKVKDAFILPEIYGSDHCPVGLVIEM